MPIHDWTRVDAGVVFTLNSDAFDCYLRLLDPTGKKVAEDDDSGGGLNGLNSRIDYVAKVSGQFKIVVTSFDGKMGAFRLQVRGETVASEKDGPVKEKAEPEKAKEKAEKRALIHTQGSHSASISKWANGGQWAGFTRFPLPFVKLQSTWQGQVR